MMDHVEFVTYNMALAAAAQVVPQMKFFGPIPIAAVVIWDQMIGYVVYILHLL